MENNNTISGFHIMKNEGGVIELNTNKTYNWNIPKVLREDPIKQGDIVLVRTKHGFKSVLVMNVFREEFEETKKRYKKVVKVLERAPEQKLVEV
ncbi:DUF5839 family protein [Bacillus sp. AK031]